MNIFNSKFILSLNHGMNISFQTLLHFFLETGIFFKQRPDLVRKIIVMLAPYLLIVTSGLDWMFGNYAIDSFNYSSIFLNFSDPEFFAGGYKFGRLPWVLSGYIAFSIFSPKVAVILLISSFFSLALLGTYVFIRNMLNSSIAFVITIALAFFTPFHSLHSGGVFYHNLSSATFLIWSFVFLSRLFETEQKKTLNILYSGLFAALALHCNITVVNFLPLFLALFYLVDEKRTLRSLVRPLVIFLGSGLLITLLLMILNWIIRGDLFFFKSIVRLAKHAIRDSDFQKAWWESWSSLWFLKKRHVLVLSGIYFGALAIIPFKNTWISALRSKDGKKAVYCVGQYIFMFTLWIFWQTEGQTALNIDYFSYPLIVPAFICLGGLLFLITKGTFSISSTWYWILPLVYLGTAISGIGLRVNSETILYVYLIASLLVFSIIFCKRNLSALAWVVVFAFLCALNNDRPNYKLKHSTASSENYTLAVVKGQQYVSNIGSWNDIRVFYTSAEAILDQNGKALGWHPISILNLWRPIVNVWDKDPFTAENVFSHEINTIINDKKTLVVISEDKTKYEKLRKLFNDYNAELVEIGNYPIKLEKGGSFSIRSFKALKTN